MCWVGRGELTEAAILKEVMFAFQGISGNYIHYDSGRECFVIDPKVSHELQLLLHLVYVSAWNILL